MIFLWSCITLPWYKNGPRMRRYKWERVRCIVPLRVMGVMGVLCTAEGPAFNCYIEEATRWGSRLGSWTDAQGYCSHKKVGPSAVAQNPPVCPERVTSIIYSNNSWTLSGSPQRRTELWFSSAEICTQRILIKMAFYLMLLCDFNTNFVKLGNIQCLISNKHVDRTSCGCCKSRYHPLASAILPIPLIPLHGAPFKEVQ